MNVLGLMMLTNSLGHSLGYLMLGIQGLANTPHDY